MEDMTRIMAAGNRVSCIMAAGNRVSCIMAVGRVCCMSYIRSIMAVGRVCCMSHVSCGRCASAYAMLACQQAKAVRAEG